MKKLLFILSALVLTSCHDEVETQYYVKYSIQSESSIILQFRDTDGNLSNTYSTCVGDTVIGPVHSGFKAYLRVGAPFESSYLAINIETSTDKYANFTQAASSGWLYLPKGTWTDIEYIIPNYY